MNIDRLSKAVAGINYALEEIRNELSETLDEDTSLRNIEVSMETIRSCLMKHWKEEVRGLARKAVAA